MVQNLASEFFWPRFQKQDGCHGRFIQIFMDFCCPSISKGMQCTLSKFAGYAHHGQSFLGNYSGYLDKNKMAAVGVSLTVFLQNTKSANVSKTVRDRAISSIRLQYEKFQILQLLAAILNFCRKLKIANISETVRDRAISSEF